MNEIAMEIDCSDLLSILANHSMQRRSARPERDSWHVHCPRFKRQVANDDDAHSAPPVAFAALIPLSSSSPLAYPHILSSFDNSPRHPFDLINAEAVLPLKLYTVLDDAPPATTSRPQR